MVDFLEQNEIDILFCIGGDGTQQGARAIHEEVQMRGFAKSIIGIPKTIDNDIMFVWMTFGFATAIEKAEEVLRAAHMEALGAPNGIALVKLMGRDSGFIAAGAALASQEANFVLVPEVPFPLEGKDGFLRERINEHFKNKGLTTNLKFLDPSYLIRSIPANGWDRVLCDRMARHAVHAAMAGKTDIIMGFHHGTMIHVPIPAAVSERRHMELSSDLWLGVLSTTGQPRW